MKTTNQLTLLKTFILTLLLLTISCEKNNDDRSIKNQEVRTYVNHLLKRHQIPGVSLAIIKNDSVLMRANFGKANLEHTVSLKNKAIFRVYSLTKLPVAVAVFQLIEKQKISLEDKITKHLESLPESWKSVTIQNLITHSSGLPKMRSFPNLEKLTENEVEKLLFKEELLFEKGAKYDYNQTNFWLLQKIIEKASGETLSNFILKNQFENTQKNVFFSSNSKEIVKDRVTAYFPFRTGAIEINHPTLIGDYMFAANGLNITLNEFIKWDKRLKNHQLLNPKTLQRMWQTFAYTNSNKIFTNGWDKRVINNHNSYGFSGSLVTAFRIFPEDNLTIIFLGNGLGNYFNIENVINHIASLVDEDIVDINNQVFEKLLQSIVDIDMHQFKRTYSVLKNDASYKTINFEQQLNDIGYQLINQNRVARAIQIFDFNTQEFPTSANAYDSLAEAYYRRFNDSLAIKNYQKAVDLGGTNGNAKRMLERLQQ